MTSAGASQQKRCAPPLASAVAIVAALTVIRLLGLRFSVTDLFFDESQYWSWSRDLQLGYFSKPPLLAWIIAGAERICGASEACIRAPAPLMYFGTSLVIYAIANELYGRSVAFWACLLCAFGTGTAFSSRIISTDVPLILCWAIALLAVVKLLRTASLFWAAIFGLAFGAGVLAKYAMLYVIGGLLVAAWISSDVRALFRRSDFWLGVSLAALIVAPHLAWNAANDFVAMKHTGDPLSTRPPEFGLRHLLAFVSSQFAVFGPVIFGLLLWALARLPSKVLTRPDFLMVAFAIPSLAVITTLSFFIQVNANWAATTFVSADVLAAALLVRYGARMWLAISVALGVLVQLVLLLGDAYASSLKPGFLPIRNPYERTLGWRAFGETAGQLAKRIGARTIAAEERSDVASLLYYWRDQPEEIRAWRKAGTLRFDLSVGLSESAPTPILFISPCPYVQRIAPYFHAIEELGYFDVPVGATGSRRYFGFRLDGLRGPVEPLPECRM
jgi:hypothetical protein